MGHRRVRKALIIGGGVAGPVAAMWLERIGVEAVIAEARALGALGEGAFLGVAPNGMNVLAELGIAEEVASAGHACHAFEFRSGAGRRLGVIDRGLDEERFGWPLTMIRRGELHAILTREATRRGAAVELGKRLTAIDRTDPDQVTAIFEDGSRVTADILLGCDGLRSTVRALTFPAALAPREIGLLDCGGFASGADVALDAKVNVMIFGRRAFFGAFRTPSGEVWWFHNGPGPAAPAGVDGPDYLAHVLELHREDTPWIAELIRATPRVLGPWSIHELDPLPRWSRDHVCLLGDAAHAMSPSAGQGASLAMEDAMVLSQCLRDSGSPVEAFGRFERLRRPRVSSVFRQARRHTSGKAVQGRVTGWLRDRLLPVFLKLGANAQTRAYAHRIRWEQRTA